MKPISVVVCFLVLGAGAAADVKLVHNSRPQAQIVLPAQPSSTELFAGEQLAVYIAQISGATLSVVREDGLLDGLVRVDVGATARNETLKGGRTLAEESILVHIDPAGIGIQGGGDRGTLFAVYRFLERNLGCRWLAQGVDFVPENKTLVLSAETHRSAPAFNLRYFNGRRVERSMDWGVKVGMNGYYTGAVREQNGNCYYMPDKLPSCHTYHQVIPSDVYFAEHPEWFPLIGGERRPGALHGAQLCVTADGLADEFAKNIIEIFDRDPDCQVTSISPNDGRGWCECETCLALDQRLCGGRTTQQGLAAARPFRGDRVFWFANEVARRVGTVHPEKLLLVLAYINYAEPPDTVKPLPNVVPYLCHYAPADYSRPISDPTSESNTQFNDILTRWASSAPHLLYYGYVSKSMWWRLPRPVVRPFSADIKHLYSLGIRRYYCQSTLRDWGLDGPLYYVIAKLLWDPTADPEALARDWVECMFGPAAAAMKNYYGAVEDAVRKSGQSYSDNPPRHVPGLYVPEDLNRARKALEQAVGVAGGTEPYAGRIDEVRRIFLYGYHMIEAIEAMQAFRQDAEIAAANRALTAGEKALTFAKTREARRYLDSLSFLTEVGAMSFGFGEAETRGGRKCWNTDETGVGDNRSGWATMLIPVPDETKAVRLTMDVWGESDLNSVVINTGGQGKSYIDGGVWTPVTPEQGVSGKPEWQTLVFTVPVDLLAKGRKSQRLGMGGADSQIWIARVKVEQ